MGYLILSSSIFASAAAMALEPSPGPAAPAAAVVLQTGVAGDRHLVDLVRAHVLSRAGLAPRMLALPAQRGGAAGAPGEGDR